MVNPQPAPSSISILPHVFLHVFDSFYTHFNKFGLVHAYQHCPSHDPDSFISVEELTQNPKPIIPNSVEAKHSNYSPPWPWHNMSIWCLMKWKSTSSNLKSNAEVTRLVHDVLKALDFNIQELSSLNASHETSHFDAIKKEIPPKDAFGVDRWKCMSINISVPTRENKKEGNGWMFSIDGVLYRPILDSMLYKRYLQRHRRGLSISHLSSGSGNPLLQVMNNVCMMNCMPPMPEMKPKIKS